MPILPRICAILRTVLAKPRSGTQDLYEDALFPLIILLLLVLGALPAWPYSAGWGYYPSGGLGLVLVILLILLLLSRI